MLGRTIAILIITGILTALGMAALGRLWRFVLIRPSGAGGARNALQRIVVLAPGPRDFAEQQRRLVRYDLPFALLFLAGSFYLLATPGVSGVWPLTLALWCGGAVIRWLTQSDRIVPIRCGIVLLLVIDAVLVLLIRGGDALPQTLAYLGVALVGTLVLYQTHELPLPFASHGPYTSYRRGAPLYDPPASPAPGQTMHRDPTPTAPRRPAARVTPITYARRNPLRVSEDEGAIVSPPYYAGGR